MNEKACLTSNLDAFRDRLDKHFGPPREGTLKTPYFLHESEWIELKQALQSSTSGTAPTVTDGGPAEAGHSNERLYDPNMELSWQTFLGNRGPQPWEAREAFIAAWYASRTYTVNSANETAEDLAFWKREALTATRILKAARKSFPNDDGWLNQAIEFLDSARLPEETTARRGPIPDALKPPVKATDVCPAGDEGTLHQAHKGKCLYCGAPMPSPEKAPGESP